VRDPLAGLVAVLGVEGLAEGGRDESALIAAAVVEHVCDEMHRAALPSAAEHAGGGCQFFRVS